jgi:hypothetical protein
MKEKVIDVYPPSNHRSREKIRSGGSSKSKKEVIFFLLLLIIVGVGYFCYASYKTEIVIKPKATEFAIREDILSKATGSLEEKELRGVVLSEKIEEVATLEVQGREVVESVTVGVIEVCQDYTEKSHSYVEGTRFSFQDDLLFRATERFVLPGVSQGGCVEVEVVADEAGEEYNPSEEDELFIPGLEGTEIYENVKGTSFTVSTEGFVKEVPFLEEEEKITAEENLKNNILEQGKKILEEEYKEEYLLGYYDIEVTEQNIIEKEDLEKVDLEIKAEVKVFAIEKELLDKFVESFIPEGYDAQEESKKIECNFNRVNFEEQEADISLIFSSIIYNKIDKEGLKREIAGLTFQEAQLKIQKSIDLDEFSVYNRPIGLFKKVNSVDRINIILDFNK